MNVNKGGKGGNANNTPVRFTIAEDEEPKTPEIHVTEPTTRL